MDWSGDTDAWTGGHVGDESFHGGTYPPELIDVIDVSSALLPTQDRCPRYGLHIVLILDIPQNPTDVWISTGPPTRLCSPDAAIATVVNEVANLHDGGGAEGQQAGRFLDHDGGD